MKSQDWIGVVVIAAIVFVGITNKNSTTKDGSSSGGFFSPKTQTEEQKQISLEKQIKQTEKEVDELELKVQEEIKRRTESKYAGIISLSSVHKSTNPNKEYLTIRMIKSATTPVLVTGWRIASTASGVGTTIPQGTYLFFAKSPNSEENIYLKPGDTLYLETGQSPIGVSFKVNKCSGYLSQFITFTPTLRTSCPKPEDEDLSSIPNLVINDACFDYIERFPSCKIETKPLPINWSYECKNFIMEKINYSSCVNVHKNDSDFYKNEWRVYLKRNAPLWKSDRENIVLYDSEGKIVDTIAY